MIPYFLSFDLPKQIVNGPIQGEGFDQPGATQTFMDLSFSLPWIGEISLFGGLELTRTQTLFALSMVFLLLVIINGLFKFYINTYKGRLGERPFAPHPLRTRRPHPAFPARPVQAHEGRRSVQHGQG